MSIFYKKSSNYLNSQKTIFKVNEQFLFYVKLEMTSFFKANSLLKVYFNNFNYLDIKILICSFFFFDKLTNNTGLNFRFRKKNSRNNKRISLTVSWILKNNVLFLDLFNTSFPIATKSSISVLRSSNDMKLCFDSHIVRVLNNYKIFNKVFELKKPSICFSFETLHLKHNLLLKNYLAYIGLFVL